MKKIILTLAFLFLLSHLFSQYIIIPGDYHTIQEGIDAAGIGDTVLIQPGTFIENIAIEKSITLASTFLLTGDYADISNTILDGGTYGPVVSFFDNGPLSSKLIGFTIKNGNKGIDCYGSTLELENLIVEDNQIAGIQCSNSNLNLKDVTIANGGASLWCDESTADIDNVTFVNNHGLLSGLIEQSNVKIVNSEIVNNSAIMGGGFYVIDSEGLLDHVNISGNEALSGGGIYFGNSNFQIRNSSLTGNKVDTIYGNPSYTGGAIYCDYSQLTIHNTLFTGNSVCYTGNNGDMHSVLYCANNSNAVLINSTITGNEQRNGWWSPEVYLIGCEDRPTDTSKVDLINTIVYYNDPVVYWDTIDNSLFTPEVTASYSNIQRRYEVYEGVGNIDEDPLFVGFGEHPFQLNDYSPCIEVGTPDTTGLNLPQFDLAGEVRFFNDRVDMGAYEWNTFVGIEEPNHSEEDVMEVLVYPNPTSNTINIELSESQSKKALIELYHSSGTKITELNFMDIKRKHKHSIDISHLQPGIYLIRIYLDQDIITKKILKH